MKVGVWNRRGAGSPLTVPQLKEVIHLHSPGVLFLCETKNQKKFMENVKKKLNFDESAQQTQQANLEGQHCFGNTIKIIETVIERQFSINFVIISFSYQIGYCINGHILFEFYVQGMFSQLEKGSAEIAVFRRFSSKQVWTREKTSIKSEVHGILCRAIS